MAYDTKELERQSIEAIKKHKLIFIEEVVTYLPCSRATFYSQKLDKLDTILILLTKNKVDEKVKLRKKWRDSDNAALSLALYKLCSTDKEQAKLNTSKSDTTVNVFNEAANEDLTKLSTDELKQRIREYNDIAKSKQRDKEKGE